MNQWRLITRLVLVLYWIALAVATHWPRLQLGPNDVVAFGVDKWLHVVCFGLLALLMYSADFFARSPWRRVVYPLLIVSLYVPVDEVTQTLAAGRYFDAGDMIASWIGVAAGLVIRTSWRYLARPSHSFVDNTRVVAGLTFLSRIFGLVREWALAYAFGFAGVLDAYTIAFMIPNLFRRLFGEGSLAVAFLPSYAQLDRDAPATARAFGQRMLRWLVMVLAGLAVVSVLVLAGLLLFGDLDDRGTLAARLTGVMIWYMPLVCTAALLGAMLQVHGRFAAPAVAPVLLNIAIITTAVVGRWAFPGQSPQFRTYLVALAVLGAGVFQVIWLMVTLAEAREAQAADDPIDEARLRAARRKLFVRWGPMIFALAAFQINTLLDSLIAMFFSGAPDQSLDLFGHTLAYPMHEGAVAVLGATARLYEFPLGVFGIAIATAIYPALSKTADDPTAFGKLVRQGLRLSVFIALPAGVGLLLVRQPLARAIFQGGEMALEDAQRVAWVLLGYAPAVWAYALNQLLTRVFYARDDARTPVRIAASMIGLNLVLNLTLMWIPIPGNPMGDRLGAAGLAWSTAICATLQCLILLWVVRRHVDLPINRQVLSGWLRTALATAVMGVVVWYVVERVPELFERPVEYLSRMQAIQLLLAAVTAGVGTMLMAALLLRMAELRWALSRRQPSD